MNWRVAVEEEERRPTMQQLAITRARFSSFVPASGNAPPLIAAFKNPAFYLSHTLFLLGRHKYTKFFFFFLQLVSHILAKIAHQALRPLQLLRRNKHSSPSSEIGSCEQQREHDHLHIMLTTRIYSRPAS